MKKVIRDGKVAVLYSPFMGPGWFTENDKKKKYLIFHPGLVEAVEARDFNKARNLAIELGKQLYGEEDKTFVPGNENLYLSIQWIPEGTLFIIDNYFGSESIIINVDQKEILVA